MSEIQRYGDSKRWADGVVYRGVAHWVEVAEGSTPTDSTSICNVPGFLSLSMKPSPLIWLGSTGPMPCTRLPNAVGTKSLSATDTSVHSPCFVGIGARYEKAISWLFQ